MGKQSAEFITTEELERVLKRRGITASHSTLRSWRRKKFGPKFVKIGGSIYYPKADVETWVASFRAEQEISE